MCALTHTCTHEHNCRCLQWPKASDTSNVSCRWDCELPQCWEWDNRANPVVEVCVSLPCSWKHESAVPIIPFTHGFTGHEEMPFLLSSIKPEIGGRASPEVIGVGWLALPLISWSNHESGPFSYLGNTGVGVGGPTLRT